MVLWLGGRWGGDEEKNGKKKIGKSPEIDEMVSFLDPEIVEKHQFLDPEICKMDLLSSGSRN